MPQLISVSQNFAGTPPELAKCKSDLPSVALWKNLAENFVIDLPTTC